MTQHGQPVNGGPAPLLNVQRCLEALQAAKNRPSHLPGIVCMYGPSGYGKSTAAAYVATRTDAYYVECRSSWTKKAFLQAVLKTMNIRPKGSKEPARTIYGMVDQAAEELSAGRPLIVDEMDYLVDKNAVEIVKDLFESSQGTILIIGEERLPGKLEAWERFHGRIMHWVPAQPADIEDAKTLRAMYCDRVRVADDLLALVVESAQGSVRRICVNLERIQAEGLADGLEIMDRAAWGSRELFTGKAPMRRGLR
ncbi:ATP-binding protein [Desulfovibrio sp. JY]|nr:ATP-binding protein [Desulfovibrio sp. JY]